GHQSWSRPAAPPHQSCRGVPGKEYSLRLPAMPRTITIEERGQNDRSWRGMCASVHSETAISRRSVARGQEIWACRKKYLATEQSIGLRARIELGLDFDRRSVPAQASRSPASQSTTAPS